MRAVGRTACPSSQGLGGELPHPFAWRIRGATRRLSPWRLRRWRRLPSSKRLILLLSRRQEPQAQAVRPLSRCWRARLWARSAYKVGGVHQHIPEIEQSISRVSGRRTTLSFTTLLAPMPRGIISTSTAAVRPGTTRKELVDCLAEAYASERFVRLLAPGYWPRTSSVSGTNIALLQVELDEHSGRAIIVSAIDNLGKGAAGQAIQNANLMLGLDESSGLPTDGGAP